MTTIKNDLTLNIDYRTKILQFPVDLKGALNVLDNDIDYASQFNGTRDRTKSKDPVPVPRRFENVYAIDCEMVYMESRNIRDPSVIDNRKRLNITQKDINNYIQRKNDGTMNYTVHKDPIYLKKVINYLEFYHLYWMSSFNIYNPIYFNSSTYKWDLKKLNGFLGTPNIVSGLARITITDFNGKIITDKFIKPETRVVWCPESSDIDISFYDPKTHTSQDYDDSNINTIYPFLVSDVKTECDFLLDLLFHSNKDVKDRALLIGHNLIDSDFIAMELKNFEFSRPLVTKKYNYYNEIVKITRDTNSIFGYIHVFNGKTNINGIKISQLVKAFLNLDVQVSARHDPSEDARASLAIYKLFREGIEDAFRRRKPDLVFYIDNKALTINDESQFIRDTKGMYLQEILMKELLIEFVNKSEFLNQSNIMTDRDSILYYKSAYINLRDYIYHLFTT